MKPGLRIALRIFAVASLLPSCGDGGVSGDTDTQEGLPDSCCDGADQEAGDSAPEDIPHDQAVEEAAGDPQDVIDASDSPGEATGDCTAAGGYCVTYPIVPDACPVCQDAGGTHYLPASQTDGAMGCPAGGDGVGAWCCLPHDPPGATACEGAGGECFGTGVQDPCPMCWSMVTAPCDGGEAVCCRFMPGG